ncbi:hypothetical protein Tco_0965325 [Tanacetum coccineum]
MTSKAQQIALDNALVAPENQRVIGKCNIRINPGMKPKEPTYQVVLDALALTTCYPAFLIIAEIDNKRFSVNVEVFRDILNICPRVLGQEFDERPTKEEALSFICELGHSREIKYITDSEVALSEAAQLKEATKQSKKDFHISRTSGSGDGTDFQSGVPDEQQRKISDTDEGTGTKPGVPDVPKYESESDKESWGDSGEEDDDDEDDIEDDEGNDDDDSDGNDDDDDNDGDDDDDNDGNDDDDSDQERTESDRDEIPNLNQFNKEHEEEEEEENVDEFIDKEDDKENEEESDDGEELYKDVNMNLRKEDVEMTDVDQGRVDQHNVTQEFRFEQEEEDAHVTITTVHDSQKTKGSMQSSSISSDFTEKLLNFDNVSPTNNEIASLMDTTVRTEEPSGQEFTLFTVPITVIPTTIPPPPHFFNPLPQQTTPTPTPTTSEVTTALSSLPDFAYVFRFNDRVTNVERDLSEMKQVDQYAQAISSIPAIVDRYIDNKLGEAIHKAIQSNNAECREEAQAEKHEYIDQVELSVRTIIREEVKTQLPQIIPKAVSNFATPVIKRNVTESLEAVVLARSSSQPKSTYEVAASLSEYELTKILLDKMEESKSHLRADYKRKLYDALVESYNTEKDLFNTYGEVFTLKRSRDDKDKDQDPSTGSDRGTKRRKSSKEAESPKDQRSKEGKSSTSFKGTSRSHHKSSGKSAHAEPSHTVDDSGVQKNQEFDTGNNDEQPDDEAVSKNDWFKKLERPPTPDPDWNKRQQVDFRLAQTWISVTAHAEKPPTSFDELMDTPIDFSAFFMNRLNIPNLTQELLVGPSFNLLKGTCKSLAELEFTRLKIMKWYDYNHLDEIEVHKEDQQLYTFKEVDERYNLNVALRMFTRRIVIQRQVEDLQLGVESYQKKLNLTKPDTFRSNLRNKTAYTAYLDLQGVIYKDRNNINRLMCTDELHKFSDGTLNDVLTALHDIASGIRMEYLPKRKWSRLDKQRAYVMIQDIDKQLFQRRLMQNLEKFVGGREYGNDLRLLERTI